MIATESEIRIALGLGSTISQLEETIVTMAHRKAEAAVRNFLQYNPEQFTHVGVLHPSGNATPVAAPFRYTSNATHAIREDFGQPGAEVLQLQHLPVRSVTTLWEDSNARAGSAAGAFADATKLVAGTDYYVDFDSAGISRSGQLIRVVGSWSGVARSIKIDYVGGYSAEELNGDPPDSGDPFVDASGIRDAVVLTAVKAMMTLMGSQKNAAAGFTGPLSSERLGDYGYVRGQALAQRLSGQKFSITGEAADDLQPFAHYGLALI